MILDMLFFKDTKHEGRITRNMIKEFIMHDINACTVSPHDLDIFLKTNTVISGRDIITRKDVKEVFEVAFKEAQNA